MAWSDLRGDRVLREIDDICARPLSPLELLSLTAEAFDRAVPTDASCWSTFDPATTMVTSAVGTNLDEHGAAAVRFFELEYALDAPSHYQSIAASGSPTALIAADALDGGDGAAAVKEHLGDMGVGQELRVVFEHRAATWGGAGLMRATGAPAFTRDEIDFTARIAPMVTEAVRRALVRAAAPTVESLAEQGPAVVVVDRDGVAQATPAATRWLSELSRTDVGHGSTPAVVRAVAAHAMSGRTVAQRIRVADGTWVVLRGAPLGAQQAIVTIERAGPPEVVSILSAALGLTDREVQIVGAVLRGLSTKEIAGELHLSEYTVQDHLKSVFAKADVNSRRELVSEVFFGVYAPRLGQPVGVDGFFADRPGTG